MGAKYYYTGRPCARGHVALRVAKGTCVDCRREDWRRSNEARKSLPKSEAAKAASRRYYEKNKELVKDRAMSRPIELRREYKRRWKERNPDTVQVSSNTRRRRLRAAQPPWLLEEHKKEMRAIYATARMMTKLSGDKYTVDHIIPLNGDNVCGLHVPWNLQILVHEKNCAKGNRVVHT